MQDIDQYGFDPIYQEDSREEAKLVVRSLFIVMFNFIYIDAQKDCD